MLTVEIITINEQRTFCYTVLCDHCNKSLNDIHSGWSVWAEPRTTSQEEQHAPLITLHEECLNDAVYLRNQHQDIAQWYGTRLKEMNGHEIETYLFDASLCAPLQIFALTSNKSLIVCAAPQQRLSKNAQTLNASPPAALFGTKSIDKPSGRYFQVHHLILAALPAA